ncbi:oligogalacturonate-specific porin KdgM family protein [Vibrio nomapromontoriensis]|uniref:oligogalacturonate-specific porin KdgM family protein n=1 Tax=Vibrio nomapromontoriensis TaxID=2910246 RepID=UPI003D0BD39C
MNRSIPFVLLATLVSGQAVSSSSYFNGNVQLHDSYLHGSKSTSTVEVGHNFDSGTRLLMEIDGIPLGEMKNGIAPSPVVTLGVEQNLNLDSKFWASVGYHNLVQAGETIQYRPLIKLGYNFDSGISLYHRSRAHMYADRDDQIQSSDTDYRFDNQIAYQFKDHDISIWYKNIYVLKGNEDFYGNEKVNTMDHEVRLTWTRSGVQPFVEWRNQANGLKNADGSSAVNNALVVGFGYVWK